MHRGSAEAWSFGRPSPASRDSRASGNTRALEKVALASKRIGERGREPPRPVTWDRRRTGKPGPAEGPEQQSEKGTGRSDSRFPLAF